MELVPIRAQAAQIYFCENSGSLSIVDRKELSQEKRAAIRKLQRIEATNNLRLLFFLAMWGVAAYAVMTVHVVVVQALSYFAMGWAIMGCAIFMHEASHGLVFTNRFLNRWVGFLCGLPTLIAFSAYRTNHILHHTHERTERDPDDIEVAAATKSLPLALTYYIAFLLGAYVFSFHAAAIGFKHANRRIKIRIVREYTLMVGCLGLLLWLFPLDGVLNIWLYPLMIASHLTSIRALPEHGLTTGGNAFTATRTVVSNKFVSFMLCNLNYHLEHHLFPGVPWYNLPEVHRLLREEYKRAGSSVYRSYTAFMIDFFKTSWSGIIPNVRLIPKHIREDICA